MTHQRRLSAATRYISDKTAQRRLGRTGLDLARTHIASGWFYGDGKKAYKSSAKAAARSGDRLPYAHWIAGLSAYRLGKYLEAADHFEAVALSPKVTGYDHAAAAFWAARSNMTGERPTRVSRWLKMAAEQSRTFYGIIARRWLGDQSPLDWSPTVLTEARLERVLMAPSGRRATALIQVGRNTRAERELRFMANAADRDLTEALIAVAENKSPPMIFYRAAPR